MNPRGVTTSAAMAPTVEVIVKAGGIAAALPSSSTTPSYIGILLLYRTQSWKLRKSPNKIDRTIASDPFTPPANPDHATTARKTGTAPHKNSLMHARNTGSMSTSSTEELPDVFRDYRESPNTRVVRDSTMTLMPGIIVREEGH